jgi:hypothetical protein
MASRVVCLLIATPVNALPVMASLQKSGNTCWAYYYALRKQGANYVFDPKGRIVKELGSSRNAPWTPYKDAHGADERQYTSAIFVARCVVQPKP